MKSSTKKLILLLVAVMPYFVISYDVVDMPFSYHRYAEHEWEYYRSKEIYHSKFFGNIPIANIGGRIDTGNGPHYVEDIAPVDGYMWIVKMINWYKAILIIVLFAALIFNSELETKDTTPRERLGACILGIVLGLCTLFDLSLSYGFSEILILILFLILFLVNIIPSSENT